MRDGDKSRQELLEEVAGLRQRVAELEGGGKQGWRSRRLASRNARKLDGGGEAALTDELTGFYNRRRFYEVLETEMYRAQRYGRSGSLLMLCLSEAGERGPGSERPEVEDILRALARTLKSSLRKADTAFRYDDDEIAVILPATDAEGARRIVDRLHSRWSKEPQAIYHVSGNPVEICAGVAQFPENAETADGLAFLADTALYHALIGEYKTILVSDLGVLPPDVSSAATPEQVYALAATVDARDGSTYGHSKRVAAVSDTIGRAIGLSEGELDDLRAAALVHDIGKVGIPVATLTKPGKPTAYEWELMRRHAAEGAKIVGHVEKMAGLVPMILHHHEWYDGTGYPYGLKCSEIPLGARIISVADAYDTMTTPRPYRPLVTREEALVELRHRAGTQFEPELVEAFCGAIKEVVPQE